MGMRPTVTLRFEPASGGTRFTREVQIRPSGIGRPFAPIFVRAVNGRSAGFVENARRALEGG